MDNDLEQKLPRTYRRLLRLSRDGLSDEAIADDLGVPAEAIPTLRDLAGRKVGRLRGDAAPGDR